MLTSTTSAGLLTGAGPSAGKRNRDHPRSRSRSRSWRWPLSRTGYLFCLPAIVLFLLLGIYTLGYGLALSFASWNGFTASWKWVGFRNYLDLLGANAIYAPLIRQAALNTLCVMVAVPILVVVISFPLAILLNSIKRFSGLVRTVYFVPYVTSGIAVYYAWNYVLQPNGAVNLLLQSVGLGTLSQPQGFLGNPVTALPTLIVVMVWGAVPVAVILFLTGLQSIDPALLEAASIDGAGWWRTSFGVTWPLLIPITGVIVLLNIRDGLQGFQTFLLMGNGAPAGHTNVLGLQAYNFAFQTSLAPTLGLSSALGWLLFIVAIIIAFVNLRLLRSKT